TKSTENEKRDSHYFTLNAFRNDALRAHNTLRSQLNSPPVQMSDELIQISPEPRIGATENLAGQCNIISGEDLVKMWSVDNRRTIFGDVQGIAHITQDLNEKYTHIGLGRSHDKGINGMYIYVANYL
ncbi:hypothetical protein Btru_076364, partial [Bulinus truncatus]